MNIGHLFGIAFGLFQLLQRGFTRMNVAADVGLTRLKLQQ